MAIKNERPMGSCECGMPMMGRDNNGITEFFCPRHGVRSEPPSGLLNKETDPGHVAMEGILASGTSIKSPPPPGSSVKAVSISLTLDLLSALGSKDAVRVALTEAQAVKVYDFISGLPTPKNLKDAKVLIKLQDQIDDALGRK